MHALVHPPCPKYPLSPQIPLCLMPLQQFSISCNVSVACAANPHCFSFHPPPRFWIGFLIFFCLSFFFLYYSCKVLGKTSFLLYVCRVASSEEPSAWPGLQSTLTIQTAVISTWQLTDLKQMLFNTQLEAAFFWICQNQMGFFFFFFCFHWLPLYDFTN